MLAFYGFGYFVGYLTKQNKSWFDGYKAGREDADINTDQIINKYQK